MRGKKAKKIRKEVYGDRSIRHVQYIKDSDGTLRCFGLRAKYKARKELK